MRGPRCAHSTPLVDGMPVSVGRARSPARSARANALKQASIMWCAFVPASSAQVQRQLRVVRDRAEELLRQLGLEARRSWRPGSRPSKAQNGRPLTSIAQARERLVHRHGRVAVAGDAAAVAERLVERLAEHDADVLGGVVRAGLEVAGRLARRGRGARGARAGRACGRGTRRRSTRWHSPEPSSASRRRMLRLARGALDLGRAWWCRDRHQCLLSRRLVAVAGAAGGPALASADSA